MANLCGAPTLSGAPCRNRVSAPGRVCGRCKTAYIKTGAPPPAAAIAPRSPHRAAPRKRTKRRRPFYARRFLGIRVSRVGWAMIGVRSSPFRHRRGPMRIVDMVWRQWRRQSRRRATPRP